MVINRHNKGPLDSDVKTKDLDRTSYASSSTVRTGRRPLYSLYSHGRVRRAYKGDNYFNDDAPGKYVFNVKSQVERANLVYHKTLYTMHEYFGIETFYICVRKSF